MIRFVTFCYFSVKISAVLGFVYLVIKNHHFMAFLLLALVFLYSEKLNLVDNSNKKEIKNG